MQTRRQVFENRESTILHSIWEQGKHNSSQYLRAGKAQFLAGLREEIICKYYRAHL